MGNLELANIQAKLESATIHNGYRRLSFLRHYTSPAFSDASHLSDLLDSSICIRNGNGLRYVKFGPSYTSFGIFHGAGKCVGAQ